MFGHASRIAVVALIIASAASAQRAPAPGLPADAESSLSFSNLNFYCPMDRDVRAGSAGMCPKCGMALVLGIPDAVEYDVALRLDPLAVRPGRRFELQFEVSHPESGERVTEFEVVHEKIFHLLIVSQDLGFFAHEHPQLGADGVFRLPLVFPKSGAYRLLTDFYPSGATPQMIPVTLTTAGYEGGLPPAELTADTAPQRGENVTISLRTEPAEPIATIKTLLFFELDTAEGLEPFLGAWAHLLAVSADGVDLIHAHPTIADGGPRIQVNMIFPRPGMNRIWIQTQREGVVNTVAFNVPVVPLSLTRKPLLRK